MAYLACTTFLLHYAETKNTKICSRIQHYVDNMTLVQRLMAYNRQEHHSQGVMLRPEMDVQLQIENNVGTLFRVYHTTINTRHVKGHQDDTGEGTDMG